MRISFFTASAFVVVLAALTAACYPSGPCRHDVHLEVIPAEDCLDLAVVGDAGAAPDAGGLSIQGTNRCADALSVSPVAGEAGAAGAATFPPDAAVSIPLDTSSPSYDATNGSWTLGGTLGTKTIQLDVVDSPICPD